MEKSATLSSVSCHTLSSCGAHSGCRLHRSVRSHAAITLMGGEPGVSGEGSWASFAVRRPQSCNEERRNALSGPGCWFMSEASEALMEAE